MLYECVSLCHFVYIECNLYHQLVIKIKLQKINKLVHKYCILCAPNSTRNSRNISAPIF